MNIYKSLPELLNSFEPAKNINELTEQFETIAKAAIFGGYFEVNNEYRIYLLDIEFYFNDEIGNIKEPQMYHKGDLPYFPKGSICPNRSGIDITFEDESQKYRASFLIRGYEYTDGKDTYINQENSGNYKPQYTWEDFLGNASCICGNGLYIKWVNQKYSDNNTVSKSKRINVNICNGETTDRLWHFSKQ